MRQAASSALPSVSEERLVYLILAEYRLILPEAPGSAGRPRNHPLVSGLQRTTWKDRP